MKIKVSICLLYGALIFIGEQRLCASCNSDRDFGRVTRAVVAVKGRLPRVRERAEFLSKKNGQSIIESAFIDYKGDMSDFNYATIKFNDGVVVNLIKIPAPHATVRSLMWAYSQSHSVSPADDKSEQEDRAKSYEVVHVDIENICAEDIEI